MKNPHAVALGRNGGSVTSKAKAAAARKNGKRGGRPSNIRIGTMVRLKRKYQPKGVRQITTVRAWIPGIPGGVQLEDALDRSRCWNVEHLEVVNKIT